MDTAHLKAFLRIAETGSISRAAESLRIAQPSLSQQLLRLEDEVGIRLFDRTARGVVLTEAGRVFQERARQLLNAAERAVADARHLRHEARGQVALAMPPSLARLVGADLVETVAAQAPLVRVRVVEAFTGSIRGWLEGEKVDLGVLYDLGALRHLVIRPLVSEPLVAIGAAGRFGPGAVLDVKELADELLILPGPQHGLRQLVERELAAHGIEPRVGQEIDSLDTAMALAQRGAGLAIVPGSAAGHVQTARIGGGGLERRLCVVRNPSHVLTHASVRVEDALFDVVNRHLGDGARNETGRR